jgi:hypothetical protein
MATDEEMACLIRAQDNKKKISATVRGSLISTTLPAP